MCRANSRAIGKLHQLNSNADGDDIEQFIYNGIESHRIRFKYPIHIKIIYSCCRADHSISLSRATFRQRAEKLMGKRKKKIE